MKRLFYLIIINLCWSCSINESTSETSNNLSIPDKVLTDSISLNTQDSEIDFYSNYENKNCENYLTISNAENHQITRSNQIFFDTLTDLASSRDTLKLWDVKGELIFERPIEITESESTEKAEYLGYSDSFKFHLVRYIDPLAPIIYYDLIGTVIHDTIRLNSRPIISTEGYLIDIMPDIHDDLTYFTLYKFQQGKLKTNLNCSFDEWMATQQVDNIYWSTNNELIVPYFNTRDYWKKINQEPTKKLKIKIKPFGNKVYSK